MRGERFVFGLGCLSPGWYLSRDTARVANHLKSQAHLNWRISPNLLPSSYFARRWKGWRIINVNVDCKRILKCPRSARPLLVSLSPLNSLHSCPLCGHQSKKTHVCENFIPLSQLLYAARTAATKRDTNASTNSTEQTTSAWPPISRHGSCDRKNTDNKSSLSILPSPP